MRNGFYGTDMNVTLDLLEPKEVSSVFVNTMLNTGDAIFGTTGLKVEVSEGHIHICPVETNPTP